MGYFRFARGKIKMLIRNIYKNYLYCQKDYIRPDTYIYTPCYFVQIPHVASIYRRRSQKLILLYIKFLLQCSSSTIHLQQTPLGLVTKEKPSHIIRVYYMVFGSYNTRAYDDVYRQIHQSSVVHTFRFQTNFSRTVAAVIYCFYIHSIIIK